MAEQKVTTKNLATEEWRQLPHPMFYRYEVSNAGRVRRKFVGVRGKKTEHILKQQHQKGYRWVTLCATVDGKRIVKKFGVHQLVAQAFIGPCPDGKQVNHIDRVRSNNSPHNLEYLTQRENIRHSIESYRGERNGRSKLTANQIIEIRQLVAKGYSDVAIAKQFPVHTSGIRNIRLGKTWASVGR